ncbi:DUF3846 domain-containing protein [Paenibacillus thermotolerans]|uniref:DUF3846 domain-containing protein n=1 Tax=Paenibacillus thermotolerans TaxID=3027807 RepID=UPI0023677A1F|nr:MULTISPECIES: DUF3846 domain-containing protein [unclassified Paenibacillus]
MPKVLLAVPGDPVAITNVNEGQGGISELIGGPLECVRLNHELTLYCNSEGNEKDLPVNPHFSQGIIKGPFVIARAVASDQIVGIEESDLPIILDTYIRTD